MKRAFILIICITINNLCYSQVDLESTVVEQLKLNRDKIEFITQKEFSNLSNETVIVIAEIEGNLSEYDESDFSLTSHILIVNSITGKIKNHFSENSKKNGWVSNAIYITEIAIDTKTYQVTKNDLAFGIKVTFRSGSQLNPYGYTNLSLYIKEDNILKKIIDDLVVNEYSGEVNVNSCYANMKKEENELSLMESSTNGYYDIQLKNTISNSIFEINAEGDCEDSEKSHEEKISILKYNNTKYE